MEENRGKAEKYEHIKRFRRNIIELIKKNLALGNQTFWTVDILRDAGCIDAIAYKAWVSGHLRSLDSGFKLNYHDLREIIFHFRTCIKRKACHSVPYKRISPVKGDRLLISEKPTLDSLLSQGFFVSRKQKESNAPKIKNSIGRYLSSKARHKKMQLDEYLDQMDSKQSKGKDTISKRAISMEKSYGASANPV